MNIQKFVAKVLTALICISLAAASFVEVKIKLGKIRGSLENSNGTSVSRFLSIGYAKPPINELRFRRPQVLDVPWEQPFEATKWSHICPQLKLGGLSSDYRGTESEDCLYLNIWSPGDLRGDTTIMLKPVLVYIHGGAFFSGGASSTILDGLQLSARGDIVVVTLNYRLGSLGFLYGNDEDAPANVGLWDQLLALEWVKDNIRYFGGDPELVTIAGESAGGMSVSLHILSSESENMFQKAIVMSGSVHNNMSPKSYAQEKASRLAAALGCKDSYSNTPLTSAEVDCLRKLDAHTVLEAQLNRSVSSNDVWPFRPVYGDKFLPKSPLEAIKSYSFKKGGSMLLGTVTNEGVVVEQLMRLAGATYIPSVKQTAVDFTMAALTDKDTGRPAIEPSAVGKLFYDHLSDGQPDLVKGALHDAITAAAFDCPINYFAEKLAKVNTVYRYVFAYPSKKTLFCVNSSHKPCHGDDVYVTFGATLVDSVDKANCGDWMKFLATFVKDEEMPMPSFKVANGQKLAPYYTYHGRQNIKIKNGYKDYICSFWKNGA